MGRLEIGFYAKGAHKAQIALQVSKLVKKSDVESERKAWKAAVVKLQALLADHAKSAWVYLEKSRLRRFLRTLAAFPAAKSAVFAACLRA